MRLLAEMGTTGHDRPDRQPTKHVTLRVADGLDGLEFTAVCLRCHGERRVAPAGVAGDDLRDFVETHAGCKGER